MNNAENVRRFLELIKTLAASYMFADPQEKRSIIKSGISNRTVIGKSLCLEPSDWLREAENCLTVLRGAHRRATNRTGDKHHTPASHGPTRYFEVLTNLARSNEVIEVYRKLENPEERDSCESRPLVA